MGSFGEYSFFVVPHYERIGERIATERSRLHRDRLRDEGTDKKVRVPREH